MFFITVLLPRKGWFSYAFGLLNRSNYFIRSYLWWKWKSFCEGCRHLFRPSTRGRWKLVLSKANFFTQCNQRICHGPYDRYWQGQLAILRPLLLLLDYKDILRLNTLVQLFLMFMDCSSVILSFINSPSFSSGTNVLLFNPDSYSICFNILRVFSLWLLLCCSSTPYKYNK